MEAPGEREHEASEHERGGHDANVLQSREWPRWEADAWARSLGALRERLRAELQLGAAEHAARRRDALRRLLQREQAQQRRELRSLGWTFHVERL